MKKPPPLSPTQQARIAVYMNGPRPGESANEFVARCNGIMTENDRQWILDAVDYCQATKETQG